MSELVSVYFLMMREMDENIQSWKCWLFINILTRMSLIFWFCTGLRSEKFGVARLHKHVPKIPISPSFSLTCMTSFDGLDFSNALSFPKVQDQRKPRIARLNKQINYVLKILVHWVSSVTEIVLMWKVYKSISWAITLPVYMRFQFRFKDTDWWRQRYIQR